MFCHRESSKNWYCSTVLTLLLLTMVSVNHIYYRQIARFHCICLSHRGCLIWVKFVKIPKQNLKANLPSSTHSLFSDKARCSSQSECALYGNFVIIADNKGFLVFHFHLSLHTACQRHCIPVASMSPAILSWYHLLDNFKNCSIFLRTRMNKKSTLSEKWLTMWFSWQIAFCFLFLINENLISD